ncbi:competence/damage-inducible protein A [Lawsonibacter celer]|jgi:nicotinamide-nucleotide amidase|uniref:competence/damage-inducible protein A n=1 Tax=Lawsonibacter celer TaxID=2986526 RepID=UPI001648D746|nr:competence/damage-inducible protein A [Lawsonibacter celer]
MSHNAELIAVGTELLLGNIANTDAQMLSQGLSDLGINVYYHTVVGDNPERLKAAVELAKTRADIIITTGGLGPTCDDLTKNVLAQCFGKKLVFHQESARRIEAYFQRLHAKRPMTENNYQQAMLPEGCTVLANDWGTAPGVAFEADGVHVIMLPGPPRECRAMFTHRAIPYLKALSDGVIVSRTLKLFGIGESSMEEQLRDEMNAMTNPTLAPYAKEGECELRITAKGATEAEAHALISPVEAQLRAKFGRLIYGADVPSLEAAVLALLKEKGLTLGTAESCTGGLIAKRMTDLPGASAAFKGGVVSYTNEIKHNVLGVPRELLDQYGAVSEPVARAMAQGARRLLGCDLAAAATGVAGPDPDDRNNPVGLVYLALAAPEGVWVRKVQIGMDRERVRHVSASHALHMAWRYLTGLEMK